MIYDRSQYIRQVRRKFRGYIEIFEKKLKNTENLPEEQIKIYEGTLILCKKIVILVGQSKPDIKLLRELMNKAKDMQTIIDNLPEE